LPVPLETLSFCLKAPSSLRIPGIFRELRDIAFLGHRSPRDLSFQEETVRIGVSSPGASSCPDIAHRHQGSSFS
jgi:hypothetical protein